MARSAIARGAIPLVLTLGLWACGGGGGSTAPTPVAAAPVITTSNTMIYVGQAVTFTATGSGTIRWGGDAPGVATVDPATGLVTGAGIGRVTIWAENAGGRTTRALRGLPSYAGTWQGIYAITRCQATQDFATIKFCGDLIPEGSIASIGFGISQTEDRVTGNIVLGSVIGTLNPATVSEGGQVPLSASLLGGSTTVRVENGNFESPAPGTMTGTFDETWTDTGLIGSATLSCSINTMSRSTGGPSVSPLLRRPEDLSFAEIVRRLTRR
jgi:hypothetical protein